MRKHSFFDYFAVVADGQISSKIYIRTKFAWYILGIPNASYTPFYTPFWIQHRILHILVTMSLENQRTTYKDFVDNLKKIDNLDDSVVTARLVLGRDLGKTDIETDDVVSLTIVIIQCMISDTLAL